MSLFPSPFSYVKTWGLSYLILVVHASSLTTSRELVVDFLALPLLAGVAFGIVKFILADFNRNQLEMEIDWFGEETVGKVFGYLLVIPLIVTVLVLLIAQLRGSYEQLSWWILATGLITGGEIGAFLSSVAEKPDSSA